VFTVLNAEIEETFNKENKMMIILSLKSLQLTDNFGLTESHKGVPYGILYNKN